MPLAKQLIIPYYIYGCNFRLWNSLTKALAKLPIVYLIIQE